MQMGAKNTNNYAAKTKTSGCKWVQTTGLQTNVCYETRQQQHNKVNKNAKQSKLNKSIYEYLSAAQKKRIKSERKLSRTRKFQQMKPANKQHM